MLLQDLFMLSSSLPSDGHGAAANHDDNEDSELFVRTIINGQVVSRQEFILKTLEEVEELLNDDDISNLFRPLAPISSSPSKHNSDNNQKKQ